MSEELNYKTFDLAAVLAGRDYPETKVKVYFDEKLGFTINKLRQAIGEADRRGDEKTAAELQKDLDGLVAQVKDAEYTIHLKGIDEGAKKGILKVVREEFPAKKDMFGREEDNLEADEAYTRKLWSRIIEKVEDPSGAISLMSEELAQELQNKAPKSAQLEINRGINELTEGASQGFEFAAKEVDFLSTASPEG